MWSKYESGFIYSTGFYYHRPGICEGVEEKERLHTVGDPANPGEPRCGCSYIHESACTSLAAQVGLCAGNMQLQRQKSIFFCQQMSCYTAGHRWSWVCSGVWAWERPWAQKIDCWVPMAGEVENIVLSFQQEMSLPLISIIFMTASLVVFIPQWVEFLQVTHPSFLLFVCLAWIWTSS